MFIVLELLTFSFTKRYEEKGTVRNRHLPPAIWGAVSEDNDQQLLTVSMKLCSSFRIMIKCKNGLDKQRKEESKESVQLYKSRVPNFRGVDDEYLRIVNSSQFVNEQK